MKKTLITFIAAVMFILPFTSVALNTTASAATADNFIFTLNEDNSSYSVAAKDTNISGAIAIPATYSGKPVTKIADSGFAYCKQITSVT
ncbi:MAG: hypothetical protein J6Q83_08255, partial [Clostridia bacterium]|nr:hypothetical protein [Clostridia bacterium]